MARKRLLHTLRSRLHRFVLRAAPGDLTIFSPKRTTSWQDPSNPNGAYINRDGQSNPNNFNGHRKAIVDLSLWVPALTAAWVLTRDRRYTRHAVDHLRAWFASPATRINPNLEYAQGIHAVTTGRNYGIIDTLHLVEVAPAASSLGVEYNQAISEADEDTLKEHRRQQPVLFILRAARSGVDRRYERDLAQGSIADSQIPRRQQIKGLFGPSR